MKKKKEKTLRSVQPVPSPFVLWKSLLGWGICVWLIFVTFHFDEKFPGSLDPMFMFFEGMFSFSLIPFLKASVGYLKSICLFLLIVAGVTSWGMIFIRRFLDESISLLTKVVLSTLVGLIFLSLTTTAFGFLALLKPLYLLSLVFLFSAVGVFFTHQDWRQGASQIRSQSWLCLVDSPVKILCLLLCCFPFFMAFVPEIFYDALVYHLGLPQIFINEGRIIDTPHVYFSRSPMLIHMLYTLAVGLDGSTLAKLMNCLFLMLGVGGCFILSRKLGWEKSAPWAVVIFLSIPIVQMNSWTTAIDSAMAGVFGLAAFCLLEWRTSEKKLFWASLTGLFSGGVFAIKYPGVVVTGLMGGVLILLSLKRIRETSIFLSLILFALFSVITVAPWLVRNYVWTGNPVYPILSSVFESRHMNHRKMTNEKNITKRSKPESVKDLLIYPWKQTMLEISNFNFVGPMMLGLLPLILLLPLKDSSVRIFSLITFGYFLLQLQVLGELRYLMPGFLLLGTLFAGGLAALSQISSLNGWGIKLILFGVSLYHLGWIFQCLESRYKPWPLIWGQQTRTDYSATMHNGLNLWPWQVMYDDIKNLPDPCRVYILGNEQVFGFPKRYWYSSVHDYVPLVLWTNESSSADELYRKMKDQGFTHLLINIPETVRLEGYKLFTWTEEGKKIFADFANRHLKLVNVKPIAGYAESLLLFEIQESVSSPHPFGDFGFYYGKVFQLGPS
ncbi:MAG: hypothetical protein KCHDKBKB_00179 [Elusimicrobia bacterium]|nr:hypothetical protein [Elusimicrobiota bacterium]